MFLRYYLEVERWRTISAGLLNDNLPSWESAFEPWFLQFADFQLSYRPFLWPSTPHVLTFTRSAVVDRGLYPVSGVPLGPAHASTPWL